MARGIERRRLFRGDEDRKEFLRRLGAAVSQAGASVYAWSLLPNHVHVLLRSGNVGVSRTMQSTLGGYATAFNCRHGRSGYLFQSRFKSIVVQEETYLLELVRYIHLNPVRAGIVTTIEELDRYPWAGHAGLLGTGAAAWQDVAFVLEQFSVKRQRARAAYRAFVEDGWLQGRRPELAGGGLRRSRKTWRAADTLPRGRERWAFDERVLGSAEFVQRLLVEQRGAHRFAAGARRHPHVELEELIARVAVRLDLSPAALKSGRRLELLRLGRDVVACAALNHLGVSVRDLAAALQVTRFSVWRGFGRGPAALARLGVTSEALLAAPRPEPLGSAAD